MLLVWRLVIGDIRRRWVQSLLLVVMVLTTTTTLALALALHHASQSPFERTRVATKGPDFVAANGPAPGSGHPSPSQVAPSFRAKWVAATAGPFPVAFTRMTARGINVPIDVEGRDSAPAAVDQPLLTAGHWVSAGGAVIEQGLAEALGLHVGETIRLGGHPFHVVGIAVSTAQPFYPASSPGLVWVTRSGRASTCDIARAGGIRARHQDGPARAAARARRGVQGVRNRGRRAGQCSAVDRDSRGRL
jgi:putative ABC transport system permease protein